MEGFIHIRRTNHIIVSHATMTGNQCHCTTCKRDINSAISPVNDILVRKEFLGFNDSPLTPVLVLLSCPLYTWPNV